MSIMLAISSLPHTCNIIVLCLSFFYFILIVILLNTVLLLYAGLS